MNRLTDNGRESFYYEIFKDYATLSLNYEKYVWSFLIGPYWIGVGMCEDSHRAMVYKMNRALNEIIWQNH
jgi:hypothetical protein